MEEPVNKKVDIITFQEKEYEFPYHYLPGLKRGNYRHARYLPNGYEYLGYIWEVLTGLKKIEFDSLLDLGCGDGRFLKLCSEYLVGKRLLGCDFSEQAIGFARAFNPGVEFLIHDFSVQIPASMAEMVDVVSLIEVLEHIEPGQINNFVKNIHATLKESGKLLLTVPSKNLKLNKKHFQHFDVEGLIEVLKGYFVIEEQWFLNRLSLRERILRRLFSNRFFILNQKALLNLFYKYYEKSLLHASQENCKRIFLVCRKIKVSPLGDVT